MSYVDPTTWQGNLVTLLHATFPTAEKLTGERPAAAASGISRDKDRFAVFTEAPLKAWPQNINNATVPMTIRFWKSNPKDGPLLATVPRDPAPIQALAASLATMLRGVLTSIGGVDYMEVEQIVQDVNDEYGVEVTLTGWGRNPASTGG